ncbi:MAG: class I adenylate-forming enzyme family protein [Burkholderiaceae bacterium]
MSHLLTLSDALSAHARLRPNKIGARGSNRSLTFSQWNHRASGLANGLLASGLERGDRVGILANNCLEWLEIYVALARAGLVAVPVNFRLKAAEVAYILKDCDARAVIAGADFCATVDQIASQLALPATRLISLHRDSTPGWTAYETLIEQADKNRLVPAVDPESMAALMYTSGTTGQPKGAIRSHAGTALIGQATALDIGFTENDTALLVMPLCHANSLYFGATFIYLGATIIVDERSGFDPEHFLRLVTQQQVTFTSLVPTHCVMLLGLDQQLKQRYDLSRVDKLMISSAPAQRDTKLGVMKLFPNCRLFELYGSTEAGWVTLLRPDQQLSKIGSVGREWVGSGAIRLLDSDGNEVPDGEVGELYSRTAYVFDGYWHNDEKTAEAFRGQWCSVGDMARRDEEGYIWLVDRKNNMIISGGENVYPSEVERILSDNPDVQDVAVIGVAHPKWGEAVHAFVVSRAGVSDDARALSQWCRSRLAAYKCPAGFSFVSAQEMPRNATGKILHRVLRERLSSMERQ